ncbi:MAG: hypothetical protein K2Y05_04525, partial [Hyphomicrobiaceae bacterium]|nr:hypothetical protein [Hyphomicrobiaceae bacterium]
KPSRLLAAQLARAPKDYGSDGKLISVLAAEHVSSANGTFAPNFHGPIVPGDVDGLRTRLIARWATRVVFPTAERGGGAWLDATPVSKRVSPPGKVVVPADVARPTAPPANDRGTVAEVIAPQSRPDLPGFVRAIAAAAAARAQGWPGNRKAFICHVFDEVSAVHPQWRLSEIEFKGMLAEAHRTGGVVLANADLKDKRFIQEFEKSAIQYKNTVWHFVRVEEP